MYDIDLSYEHKTQCPKCARKGRDNKHNNLHVYGLDGQGKSKGAYCWSCEWTIPSEEYKHNNQETEEDIVEEIVGTEFNDSIHVRLKNSTGIESKGYRGLRTDITKSFGVRYQYSEEDGNVSKMYYPCTVGYELCGYKVRIHPKDFTNPVGDTGKNCELFGQFKFKTFNHTIIITGGECYSDDTEVLTNNGWKLFKDLSKEDLVCQVDGEYSSFVKPLDYIEKDYSGDLYHYSSKVMDCLVTPKHKMVSYTQTGKEYYHTAEEGFNSKMHKFSLVTKTSNNLCQMSNDQLALIIAVAADSKVDRRVTKGDYCHFSFKKDRKISRLKNLLERLSIPYAEYSKKQHKEWSNGSYHTINFTLPDWVESKGLPTSWLYTLSLEQKRFVIKELVNWDGNPVKDRQAIEFSSKLKSEADLVKTLAETSGMYASIRKRSNDLGEWYCVKISFTKTMGSYQAVNINKVPYKGKVYCVTVPSGKILTRRNNKTLVCGNCDALSAFQMLSDSQKNKNFDPVACVSPTIGESGAYKQIQKQYDFFNQFRKIIVCMDNDEAGQEATDKIIKVLPRGKVYILNMRYKDPNEYIQKGKEQDFINDFWAAKLFTPAGIHASTSLLDAALKQADSKQISLPRFLKQANEMFGGGLVKNELTGIFAQTSVGKSLVVDSCVVHWVLNEPEETVGVLSLEATASKYATNILSNFLGERLIKMAPELRKAFLTEEKTKEKITKFLAKDDGSPRFYVMDERGSGIDVVKEKILEMIIQLNVTLLVVDVYSDLTSGMSLESQEELSAWCKKLIKEFPEVSVILVLHTRKVGKGESLTESDIIGSSTVMKSMAHTISLERNKLHENKFLRNVTKVTIHKNRHFSETGPAGEIYFEVKTSQLHDLDEYLSDHPELIAQYEGIEEDTEDKPLNNFGMGER